MIEPIGIFTVALGLYCLTRGYGATVTTFIVLTLLGSAAALTLGGSSVPPAHLFLLFVLIAALRTPSLPGMAINAFRLGKPAFWLAGLLLYGAISAYFSPRLFAGMSHIIPLGASEYPSTGGTVPLGPVSSNLTQTIYLTADLLCFVIIASVCSTKTGFRATFNGLLAWAAVNVMFALLDLATSATGTEELLQFMRNAQYTFHDSDTINGMKRIVGSWPEASAFAGMTLGALGFTGTLWICGRYPGTTGLLALCSFVLIILSTSSTGLIAAPICLFLLYLTAVLRCGISPESRRSTGVVLLAPPIALGLTLIIVLQDNLFRTIYDYVDLLVLSKSTSGSAVERGSWNLAAWQNFTDSLGLGVGLGTARTSSFPMALLSNVGVPGTVFFLVFLLSALRPGMSARTFESDVRLAACNGCLGLLAGSLVAGPTVDLGLLFFVLAGLTASRPLARLKEIPLLPLRGSGVLDRAAEARHSHPQLSLHSRKHQT
ncbi:MULTISPECIES: hypothetical protein [unclassified Rhizobium]|uniref:hypothetical protein n=1 Tax=unclassified Rhizobium TaxID=2613769 RepID=UPI0016171796|nr:MULTISPECIES: hypothetical protein [unclassified Rhizobium]MBB3318306.1 hypothetical protein [Rhizobium sp. BK181]MCS4094107.1 hypothetical protein [Rhizobium sp. BK176]